MLSALSNNGEGKNQKNFASAMSNKINPENDSKQKNIDYRLLNAFQRNDDSTKAKETPFQRDEKKFWRGDDELIMNAQNKLPFHPYQDFSNWFNDLPS